MTKYREILRLKSLGYSERNIALCCSVSRNTVAKVCARAKELGITWPLAPDQTDKVLSKMYYDNWDGKLPGVVTSGSTLLQIPTGENTAGVEE